MKNSPLVDGCIPAHTECPYAEKCEIKLGGHCHHQGLSHTCAFSCAVARAFEIVNKYEAEP